MTTHNDSDGKVEGYRERWSKVHEITKEWVARMTTLVECWNKLDGNVGELSSWVTKQVTTIINIDRAQLLSSISSSCPGLHGCGRKGRFVNREIGVSTEHPEDHVRREAEAGG